MEGAITSEEEFEKAAIRIGQLKGALPGSPEEKELNTLMQALVNYEKQHPSKSNQQKGDKKDNSY